MQTLKSRPSGRHLAPCDQSRCRYVSRPHDDRYGLPRERVRHATEAASSAAIWGHSSLRAPTSTFDTHQTRPPAESTTPLCHAAHSGNIQDGPAAPVQSPRNLTHADMDSSCTRSRSCHPLCRLNHNPIGPVATLPFLSEMMSAAALAS